MKELREFKEQKKLTKTELWLFLCKSGLKISYGTVDKWLSKNNTVTPNSEHLPELLKIIRRG